MIAMEQRSVFGMKTTQVDCPFGLRADTKHMVGKKKKSKYKNGHT